MFNVELCVRLLIGLFFIYACIYAISSIKIDYWKQCWYVILLGSIIHMTYIITALTGFTYASYLRNLGMGIVAIGIIMVARRTKDILG
ncbi:MAG: hypothetical protein C5S41_03845 [Candidatus Methanomarinus sp.]|nr:MAG: hypothetical protein C5S41_03845 [ANME-2 cluster archaeon]KAF5426384.1 hypothetical protein C5S42_07755 [ANME-2 cluster archaeon]